MPYANNKGGVQPAHLSIVSFVSISEMSRQQLASVAEQPESYLVENPEDRFSRDKAQLYEDMSVHIRQTLPASFCLLYWSRLLKLRCCRRGLNLKAKGRWQGYNQEPI